MISVTIWKLQNFDFLATFWHSGVRASQTPWKRYFRLILGTFLHQVITMTHLHLFKSINTALQLSNAVLDDYFEHLERFPWLFENGKILTFWRFFGIVAYEHPSPPENTNFGRFWARFYEKWQLGSTCTFSNRLIRHFSFPTPCLTIIFSI